MYTGWSNVLFLFVVCSGLCIWFPRTWTWQHLRPVIWFTRGARGRARDFNWHNAIGVWCLVPLFIVVLSAVPISFPWASDLVYRVAGEARPAGGAARRRPACRPRGSTQCCSGPPSWNTTGKP